MIVEMSKGATREQVDHVVEKAHSLGFEVQLNLGTEKTVVAILGGDTGGTPIDIFAVLQGVEGVTRVMKPYKLASREFHPQPTKINVGGVEIGGQKIVIMAGPCAVESERQLTDTAKAVKELGGSIVRGGAFKPRTSPFSFQGLEEEGVKLLAKVRADVGIPIITEVVDSQNIELLAKHADILQVGARNMQNFSLLKDLSKLRQPIMLKRGLSATVTEWLTAADYLLAEGNQQVMLCERGIRTYETYTRYTLDISAIPAIKELSNLPIIVDPSHSSGRREMIKSLSWAAIAAGADGLLIETHFSPDKTVCDSKQTIDLEILKDIIEGNEKILNLWHRK